VSEREYGDFFVPPQCEARILFKPGYNRAAQRLLNRAFLATAPRVIHGAQRSL
jgi:hypothetical protein